MFSIYNIREHLIILKAMNSRLDNYRSSRDVSSMATDNCRRRLPAVFTKTSARTIRPGSTSGRTHYPKTIARPLVVRPRTMNPRISWESSAHDQFPRTIDSKRPRPCGAKIVLLRIAVEMDKPRNDRMIDRVRLSPLNHARSRSAALINRRIFRVNLFQRSTAV